MFFVSATVLVSGYVVVLLLLTLLGLVRRYGPESYMGLSWQVWCAIAIVVCLLASTSTLVQRRREWRAAAHTGRRGGASQRSRSSTPATKSAAARTSTARTYTA